MLGNILLLLAAAAILHAAFSTYEHLSHLKALGRPEGSLPPDIVVEALVGLVLGIIGAAIRAPELRDITWKSEMKKRSMEDMDPRLSFATFARRAGIVAPSTDS